MYRHLGWESQEMGWIHLTLIPQRVEGDLWRDLSAELQGLHAAIQDGAKLGPLARIGRPQGRINRHLASTLLLELHTLEQMEGALPPLARRRLTSRDDLDTLRQQAQQVLHMNAVGTGQHWIRRRIQRDQETINFHLGRLVVRVRERALRMAELRLSRSDTESFQGFKPRELPPRVSELATSPHQTVRWRRPQQQYNRALRAATTEIHDLLRWIDQLS